MFSSTKLAKYFLKVASLSLEWKNKDPKTLNAPNL